MARETNTRHYQAPAARLTVLQQVCQAPAASISALNERWGLHQAQAAWIITCGETLKIPLSTNSQSNDPAESLRTPPSTSGQSDGAADVQDFTKDLWPRWWSCRRHWLHEGPVASHSTPRAVEFSTSHSTAGNAKESTKALWLDWWSCRRPQ